MPLYNPTQKPPVYQFGILSISGDPGNSPTAGASQGTGKVLAVRLPWTVPAFVTSIDVNVSTAGATLTAAQNLACLYDSAGNKIANTTTADQSTAWTSTGAKFMNIGTAQTIPADPNGYLYAAFLAVGTTIPLFTALSSTVAATANLFIPSGVGQRCGVTAATGQTALPASIVLTTMTAARVTLAGLS